MVRGAPDYSSKVALPSQWKAYTGTAITAGTAVNFAGTASGVYIENTGDTYDMMYSLDAGVSWATLEPGGGKGLNGALTQAVVKGVTGSTTYLVEITYGG